MGAIFMLSGPVGSGKSTVARELVRLLPEPLAYIDGDDFWRFFAKPETGSPRERFHVIMRAMTAASVQFARTGFDVLLDFSIPPHFLESARKFAKEIELHYVMVCPSEAVCAARAAARSEGAIADYTPYREFYALFAGMDQHKIGDDDEDPAAVAAQICDGLAAGRFRLP